MADYQKILRQLKSEYGAISSAIVARDGTLIAGDIQAGVHPETLTIMCATIMGAAVMTNSELKIGQPKLITITSDKHETLVAGVGSNKIIVTIVPRSANIELLQQLLIKGIESMD